LLLVVEREVVGGLVADLIHGLGVGTRVLTESVPELDSAADGGAILGSLAAHVARPGGSQHCEAGALSI
jgi:hypothetical protein